MTTYLRWYLPVAVERSFMRLDVFRSQDGWDPRGRNVSFGPYVFLGGCCVGGEREHGKLLIGQPISLDDLTPDPILGRGWPRTP